MNKTKEKPNTGSDWRKWDLHAHSPASERPKTKFPRVAYLQICLTKKTCFLARSFIVQSSVILFWNGYNINLISILLIATYSNIY